MKLKHKVDSPSLSQRIIGFLKNRKALGTFIWSCVAIGLAGMLFFAVLGYGAYLKKVGETAYYKHALLRIADMDFSFLKNYTAGKFSKFDEVKIDIKFKHLQRLQYLREQALAEGIISDAVKGEDFPATLTYNGEKHEVKVSLTGMMTMHVSDPIKWSFQVKVKGDDTIQGMKRFGMLIPTTRGYLTDWIGMELMKDRGLIGLRVDFANVSVNGKSLGIYYMEERFDKYLLEHNNLRESIIFKLDEKLSPYQEQKVLDNPETRAGLLTLQRRWQDVLAGTLEPGKFFDLEKMAKLFAITDLMNNKHALYRSNLRFYLNPVTGLVEPIAREWGSLSRNKHENFALFIEEPKKGSMHSRIARDSIMKTIYDNLEFKRHYLKEIELLAQKDFLDQLLTKNGDKLHSLMTKVYRDWPFYELPTHSLYENQYYLKAVINSDLDLLSGYFYEMDNEYLNIYVKNQQELPLEVYNLSWRDSVVFVSNDQIILDETDKDNKIYKFKIPENVSLGDSIIPELKIHYSYIGLPTTQKSALIFPYTYEERFDYAENPVAKDPNYQDFEFISENETNGELTILSGKWVIDKSLVIPAQKTVTVQAGTEIDILNEARVICHSPVYFEGTEDNRIKVTSSDKSSMGIMVIRAGQRSQVSYTDFSYLSCPRERGWNLPGAVTFYESPVDIVDVTFADNQIGDDFLNIVRSNFTMERAHFKNIKSDAFDCDFCTGQISNSSFSNVGNDGVDVSGTDIELSNISMTDIGDKGLSAGEGSEMRVKFVDIKNAEIGITSKDRSRVILSDAQLLNSRIGVTLFQKKSEFGPAYATIDRIDIKQSTIPYLIEDRSSLYLNGEEYLANRSNVKELLYGAEFGKSSK